MQEVRGMGKEGGHVLSCVSFVGVGFICAAWHVLLEDLQGIGLHTMPIVSSRATFQCEEDLSIILLPKIDPVSNRRFFFSSFNVGGLKSALKGYLMHVSM